MAKLFFDFIISNNYFLFNLIFKFKNMKLKSLLFFQLITHSIINLIKLSIFSIILKIDLRKLPIYL